MEATTELILTSAGFQRLHACQEAISAALNARPEGDWRWRKRIVRKLRKAYALSAERRHERRDH